MINYYKILEVDQNASQEIIDKAYRILVKKYHPDLQNTTNKSISEEKIKQINEAYSILSDPQKRQEYNLTLGNSSISEENYNIVMNENMRLKEELNNLKEKMSIYTNYYQDLRDNYDFYKKTDNNQNSYNQHYANYNNTTSIKTFFIKLLKLIVFLGIFLILFFLLLQIPFINNLINSFFNSNSIYFLIAIILIILFLSDR